MLKSPPQQHFVLDENSSLADKVDCLPYNRSFEIYRELFILINVIGEGKFGKIFKGELKVDENSAFRLVAVKVPRGKHS